MGTGVSSFMATILPPGRRLPHARGELALALRFQLVRDVLRIVARPVLRKLELAFDPLDFDGEAADHVDEPVDESRGRLVHAPGFRSIALVGRRKLPEQ